MIMIIMIIIMIIIMMHCTVLHCWITTMMTMTFQGRSDTRYGNSPLFGCHVSGLRIDSECSIK